MQRGPKFNSKSEKARHKKPMKSVPHPGISDYERWNNLCAALAEDALLDETPPGTPDDVDRIRKRIAQITQQYAHAKRESDHKLAEIAYQCWEERSSQERQESGNQEKPLNEPPAPRKM
jgi:hypothetical protein